MDIKSLIINEINKKKQVRVSNLVKKTGFTRSYLNRFIQELLDEGKILRIGRARQTRYILPDSKLLQDSLQDIKTFTSRLRASSKPEEDRVLDRIKKETGILLDINDRAKDIIDYAFTEMLNNAIEHSQSEIIDVKMKSENGYIRADITDSGIGIFNNIKQKYSLASVTEAIQELLKGKRTTAEKEHTGEGIFFTSKAVDMLIIQSSGRKLIFNNILNDIFIRYSRIKTGTYVMFSVNLGTTRDLKNIFLKYSDEEYDFSETDVLVKLFKEETEYLSRSQARRILIGLDKFKTITLDFSGVITIGQSFADEVFRVWKQNNRGIKILVKNTNENIDFMINRAKINRIND